MSSTTQECTPGTDCANGNGVECCELSLCKKRKCFDDVGTVCIFVEKVWDARIIQVQLRLQFVNSDIQIEPPNLVSIETINVDCKILSFTSSIQDVSINGKGIAITLIPGPGGEQYALNQEDIKNAVDTAICEKECKGTKVELVERINIVFTLEIIVTGTGIDSGGNLVDFIGTVNTPLINRLQTFVLKNFCIPPLSAFPISLFNSCLSNCSFVIVDAQLKLPPDAIELDGTAFLCTTCETKIMQPTQICALTIGPCDIEEEDYGFCKDSDFPD